MLEIEQCNDSHDMKTEIDDVFDEILEKKLKTKKEEQVQYIENDDVLNNKLTLTVKCLFKEEKDDVFDEERENSVGFVKIDTGIKIELDEENSLQENFYSSTNVIKEDNDISSTEYIQGFNSSLMANIINDNGSFIEVYEQKIKAEYHVESEETRIIEYHCRECTFKATQRDVLKKHFLSHKVEDSDKGSKSEGTQMEVEESNVNLKNDFEIIEHSKVEGGKKDSHLKSVKEKSKHMGGKQTETKKIQLRKQNKETVNAITSVDNITDKGELGKKDEICNSSESAETSNRRPSNRKKLKEDSAKSYSKNANKMVTHNRPEISITGKENNLDRLPKKLSAQSNINNDDGNVENRDIRKEYIIEENKSEVEKDGQKPLNEKNKSFSAPNKTINGEEKTKSHGKQPLKIIAASDEKGHKEMEHAETTTINKAIVETETNKNKTDLRIENQKCCKKSLDENEQNNADTLLSSNSSLVRNVVNDDLQLENIEYCCTKCSFKSRHRTIFKSHLTIHGTKIFTGVITFLDLANNEEVAADQLDSGQVQDEIKEQCTEETRNTVDNEAQTEDEKAVENKDKVEICNSSQSSSQITGKNDNRVTEVADNQRNEILNMESNTVCKENETVVLDKENEESLPVELENSDKQTVQIEETQILIKNISIQIELLKLELENQGKLDNSNENGEVLKEINTKAVVTDKGETPLQIDKNYENVPKTATNVDNMPENVENLTMQNHGNKVLKTNDLSQESGKSSKRKLGRTTKSASKKIKLENDVYRCDECSYQSHNKRYLDNHKVIHSKDIVKCSYCEFTTKLKKYMASHMLVHLQPEEIKMYKCPHCSYQTKRRGDLPNHMVMHKKPEEIKMFQCDKCSYKTKRKTNLRSHQHCHISASDAATYNCPVCPFTAKRKYTVKTHMIVHKKMEEISWYKCDQCYYITKYKTGLKTHSLIHKNRDEIKTYDCSVCPYRAKHKSHLKSHLLLHKDPKEVEMHRCDHCPYKSVSKCNLTAHMLQHKKTEEIDMKKCAHCSYQTKLKCNLIKHLNRIHSRRVV